MRLIRGEVLEVPGADFIKFARARGLSDRAVYLTHALRNSPLPVIPAPRT
jgi:peptide/nickel transport system permease protein